MAKTAMLVAPMTSVRIPAKRMSSIQVWCEYWSDVKTFWIQLKKMTRLPPFAAAASVTV